MVRLKHPPGLYVLFFTEMWERFSFYCMAAVFMLYMEWPDNGHPFLQEYASLIYGLYVGTVYFTPFFGGMLADQKWGYRLAIVVGGLVMGLGHLLLGIDQITCFFLGLLCLVIGNGLFKPNISTLVGKLYPPNDPRLDGAYTIFYMGINLGAFTSPLMATFLKENYGFHTAFGAAGVGMAISIAIFLSCQRWLVLTGPGRTDQTTDDSESVPPEVQRRRHQALLLIFVIVTLFWMAFYQSGNTFVLWFKHNTDRTPPEWLKIPFLLDKDGNYSDAVSGSINPLYVILLSPLMVWLWAGLRKKGLEPTTPAKLGIGMVLTAVAFGIMASGARAGGDMVGVRVSPLYLLAAYAAITVAELCLSPIGLSLVSKLASPRQRAAWMGGWFVATAVGGYLSGLVGYFWKSWLHSTFFLALAASSLFAGGLLLLCYRRLVAAMPSPKSAPGSEALRKQPEAAQRFCEASLTGDDSEK
jgi:POT family proton-dependent oligopeptide transporter